MLGLDRGWIALFSALLFVLLAFSGCLGGDSTDGTEGSDGGATTSPEAGNVSVEASPVLAVIAVFVDGNESQAVNGSIPALEGANLTFDGSRSTGTNLSFAWDFGDGTNGTHANETHAYAAAGLFNATLAVASGNETSTASVAINVSSAGPKPGDLVWADKKQFSGSLPVGNPNTATAADVDYRDHVVEIVGAAPDGTPAMAKRVKIVLDGSGAGAVYLYLYWRSPTGSNLASGTTASQDQTITFAGDMAPGKYVVRVRLFAGVQASYTVKADIDYLAT